MRLTVVKVGGDVARDVAQLEGLAHALSAMRAEGEQAVVVHGGGPQASELSRRLGIAPVQVEGRRVTDGPTREVAKMVFAGTLNTEIVAALAARGLPATGLSGIDGGLLRVSRRPPVVMGEGANAHPVDFGFVGDVEGVHPGLLTLLLEGGFLPVVCSLAADPTGEILNVNADTVAAELAIGLNAARLVLVTPAGGVWRGSTAAAGTFAELTAAHAQALLQDGTASDGMRPKLTACLRAVEGGVPEACVGGVTAARPIGHRAPRTGTRIVATPRHLDAPAAVSMFMRHHA